MAVVVALLLLLAVVVVAVGMRCVAVVRAGPRQAGMQYDQRCK